MILSRRSFLSGLLAAPIIVRPGILMPVKPLIYTIEPAGESPIASLLPPGEYFVKIADISQGPSLGTLSISYDIVEPLRKTAEEITYIHSKIAKELHGRSEFYGLPFDCFKPGDILKIS